ncbi:MAG: DUF4139 domain-containing protein [Pseudohongiellaceae bacterium]
MQKLSSAIKLLGLGFALFGIPGSKAAEIDLSLPIDAVTVYPAGAEVTRAGLQSLPPGSHQLVFANLPPRLDPARLVLEIASDAVRLGSLQLQELHLGDLAGADEQRLQLELEDLQDERMAIIDEIAAANTQLKLLDSLAAGAGSQETGVTAAELPSLLASLSTASAAAREVIRNANRRLREQDREIAQKEFELSQVATRQQTRNVMMVNVEVSSAVTARISLTYPVPQARWNWLYESRLDTDSRQLELQRMVSVQQTSGENWDDVELTITTARPDENTQTPQLGSLLVDFLRPMPMRAERQTLSIALDSATEAAPASMAMEIMATQYLVEFKVPGRTSLEADSQPRLLPLDRRLFAVDLVTRAVPERDLAAYLEARFRFEDSVPLQGGLMQFYRDGAFIGRRTVPAFLPQEDVNLPFGRDERVTVSTLPVEEESRDGGLLRRNAVDEHRLRYEITSFHAEAIDVEVLGRLPVSQNSAITVEVINGATPAAETDVDGNVGVILWRVTARPGQAQSINHFYRVSYPQDNQLWYQDN